MRDTQEKIRWALAAVMEECQRNGGIYPPLNRKPTLSNILVRAGLPRTFLEKRNRVPSPRDKRNAKLKLEINEKLGNVRTISLPVPEKVDVPEGKLVRQLKEGWHEAELNLVQANADIRTLQEELSRVKKENIDLRESNSPKKT
jgi:hypothetical protein